MAMKIRWTGSRPVRRLVGPYEWSKATGYVQEVAAPELAATLLTDPSGQFVAEDVAGADAQALGDALGVAAEDVVQTWGTPGIQTEQEVVR